MFIVTRKFWKFQAWLQTNQYFIERPLEKNFYNNDKENGNDNTNDFNDIDNNNVNLNLSNNDNDNKPYLPRVRSRWIYLRTLIFRPITLTYLLGFLWNIRPKEVAKLTSGYNASYKGT